MLIYVVQIANLYTCEMMQMVFFSLYHSTKLKIESACLSWHSPQATAVQVKVFTSYSHLLPLNVQLWVWFYMASLEKPHLPWSLAKVARRQMTAARGQSRSRSFEAEVHECAIVCVRMRWPPWSSCDVFQPRLSWLWLDRRGSVWPAKTRSSHTNSELCMVGDGKTEGLVTEKEGDVEKRSRRGLRGRQNKGRRAEEIHHGGKMCTHT